MFSYLQIASDCGVRYPFHMEITPRIRELRQAKGLTLKELSEMIGISIPHLSEIERGKKNLNNHLMARLSTSLGVSPSDLIADSDDPEAETFLSVIKSLNEEKRQQLIEYGHFLLNSQKP